MLSLHSDIFDEAISLAMTSQGKIELNNLEM